MSKKSIPATPVVATPAVLSPEDAKKRLAQIREEEKARREEEKSLKKILDTSKLDKEFAKMGDLATVNVRTAVIAFFTVPETGKAIQTAVQSVVPPAVKSAFASLPNGSKVKLTDEEAQTVTGACFG